jgi:integrase
MRGDGIIYRRQESSIWWCKYYCNGRPVFESTGTCDKTKAGKYLKDRIIEVGADRLGIKTFIPQKARKITVSDLLDNLEENLTIRHKLSPQVKSKMKPLKAVFGWMLARSVTDEMILEYIGIRQQGVPEGKFPLSKMEYALREFNSISDTTINRELQILRQSFRLRRKDVGEGPSAPKFQEMNVREGFFNRRDFEAIVEKLPDDLKDYARFAYLVGWRKGELASLGWDDLTIETRELRLKRSDSKNGEPRKIILEDELWEIIQRRWVARKYKDENGEWHISPLVFYRVRGKGVRKTGTSIGDFHKIWKKACEDAEIPPKYFHDFRRTAVRNMRRAGVSEEVAMKISGHKTPSVFKRYNITDDRDIVDALSKTQKYVSSLPVGDDDMSSGTDKNTKEPKAVTEM